MSDISSPSPTPNGNSLKDTMETRLYQLVDKLSGEDLPAEEFEELWNELTLLRTLRDIMDEVGEESNTYSFHYIINKQKKEIEELNAEIEYLSQELEQKN